MKDKQNAWCRLDQRYCLFETETPVGGDRKKKREQSIRVKRPHNQERLPGRDECGAEPGKGQMPLGEDWLIVRKENKFACFPRANIGISWGRGLVS